MKLTSISARRFLALPELILSDLDHVTFLTGANNAGKSSTLAVARLVKDALAACANGMDLGILDREWVTAGHSGNTSFEVRLGVEFDERREQGLLDDYLRSAWLPLLHWNAGDAEELAAAVDEMLGDQPAAAMYRGDLLIARDGLESGSWLAAWEFDLGNTTAHVGLGGPGAAMISDQPATFRPTGRSLQALVQAATNDLAHRVRAGRVPLTLQQTLPGNRYPFTMARSGLQREPLAASRVAGLVGEGGDAGGREPISFAQIMNYLAGAPLTVTPNHRVPPRTEFQSSELVERHDVSDGGMVAAELHRLKNGNAAMRQQYERVREIFTQLTDDQIESAEEVVAIGGPPDAPTVMNSITPVVLRNGPPGQLYDVPLRRSGAAATEALHLALILGAGSGPALLDEPGIHLSPTAQRRLLALLKNPQSPQTIVVTHNPALVPAATTSDLGSIIRMAPTDGGVAVNRLSEKLKNESDRTLQLMASSDFRAILFSAGVILCEGETEIGLLSGWIEQAGADYPERVTTLDTANVVLLNVNGDSAFPRVVDVLKSLAIPWAIIADGPALRPSSHMSKGLARLGLVVPKKNASLQTARVGWQELGVYTLADDYGDDGSKAGEIEAFMKKFDQGAFNDITASLRSEKGFRVGAAFAARVPVPEEVIALLASVLEHLGCETGVPE